MNEDETQTYWHRSRMIEIIKWKSGWYYMVDDQGQPYSAPLFKTATKAFVAARTMVDVWYKLEGPRIGPLHER